jgi:hypothetical protein
MSQQLDKIVFEHFKDIVRHPLVGEFHQVVKTVYPNHRSPTASHQSTQTTHIWINL